MAEKGKVCLVGAGPGDPGLLTVRGRECLEHADVVIYDQLANPELLDWAAGAVEKIYVGKQAGHHSMRQEDINALLVRKAAEGNLVVRLKGGDPYVFGRGGEEALELQEAGIGFEIVPGITAGIAAPAYAGIPVTHRECNSVLTFVTGHEDPTKEASSIDWEALARGGGTLAFYMGVRNLPGIAENLIRGGRSPDTPVALIRCGTRTNQEVVEGTLATIAARVDAAGLRPPAITLVGDVVRLRPRLRWFDQLPLFGRTVVVTRSRTQASTFARELADLGAAVQLCPTIRIEAPEDDTPLRQAVENLTSFDWILFTSVNAVDSVFGALEAAGGDARSFAGQRLAVIGTGTARRLLDHGIRADLMPPRFISESLFATLRDAGEIEGHRFLLPRADIAPKYLPDALRKAGAATVTEVTAYRTLPGEPNHDVFEALRAGTAELVTFTSSSTARNFAGLVRARLGELPSGLVCASIGPETSAAATAEGMTVAFEAEEHTIPGLVKAIKRHFLGAD